MHLFQDFPVKLMLPFQSDFANTKCVSVGVCLFYLTSARALKTKPKKPSYLFEES